MTVQLPEDLEQFVHEQVRSGRFASEAEVVRAAIEQLRDRAATEAADLGSIGAMRDDADLLDEIVERAMRIREERPWRLAPGE